MARHRKPAPIRELEGNRSKRDIPAEIVTIGYPEPPDHLTPDQSDRWADIVRSLPDGFLTRADTQTLERMAIAWAQFREATRQINRSALLTTSVKDPSMPVRNPLLLIQQKAAHMMHEAGITLGLSPLARTRLTQPETIEADPLETLLGPHGKAWSDERHPAKN